jgi:hypothetical protein
VIHSLGPDSAQEQDICALRLNGQTYLGLHLEVGRGAALHQVDKGEVPEVKGQIHARKRIPNADQLSRI